MRIISKRRMSGTGETATGSSNEFPPSPPSSDSYSPPPEGSSPSLEQNLLLPNSSSKPAPPPLNSSSSSPPLRSSKSPPHSQLPPESESKADAPAPPLDVGSPPPGSPQGSSSKNPSPPLDSEPPKASPPPSNSKASPPPPSNSKASPPRPSNSKASPPPPPSNSKASPPPPPSNSKASPPPPPSHSKASLSPPSNSKASPPSPSAFPPPPPSPDEQSPPPSVSQSSPPTPAPPPPAADDASHAKQSPPPASPPVSPPTPTSSPEPPSSLPQKSNPSPPTELSPRTVSQSSPPPRSSPHGQTPSHPSNTKNESSSSKGSSNSSPGSSVSSGTLIGVAVAGVVLIAVISVFLLASRRKRRQAQIYSSHYTAPNKVSVTSDGYYYHQQQAMGGNNGGDVYYQSSIASSYGSQRGGNVHQGGAPDASGIGNAKSFFSYEELTEITGGFSHENVLGEGGFGCVYKGWLPDGRVVAVKQLRAGSGQGDREFRAEVEIISRVHHRHLVSLVGYCISENQRLLIYEFVPNKTLEHHLHGQGMPALDWTKRLKIAVGAAKGLAYLHEDCHPKIIHRDIKSANILLDDAFEAQVADFGLAKLANDANTHVSTRIMGTFGYLAPEYASSGKLTDRSDVYSFGVVLLELVTGRKPVDATQPLGDESLVEWARPLLIHALETCDFGELVDPRLEKQYVESEMFRMIEAAAACVRHSAPRRPRMAQVVRALDSEAEMSDLSNGVKYGQSTTYDSGQYNHEITRFRRMALGSNGSGYAFSGEHNSREMSGPQSSWKPQDDSSGESETRAINGQSGQHKYGGAQGISSSHRF